MVNTSTLFLLAILPVVFLLVYVYSKDKHKEPFFLLMDLFLLGIVASFWVVEISDLMEGIFPFMNYTKGSSFGSVLLYAYIGVALIEEGCKWIMVYLAGYNNRNFDEKYDIIVYAVFVSLGFAFFENILYVFTYKALFTALVRSISAVPSHACDAIFMGYYMSLAKTYGANGDNSKEKENLLWSLLIPTLLHGTYDFCLLSNYAVLVILFVAFVIFSFSKAKRTLDDVASTNGGITMTKRYCPFCGSLVSGEVCSNCGMPQSIK